MGLQDQFQTNPGLQQGNGLKTIMFNLSLEKVVRDTRIERKSTITTIIRFSDDINILGRTLRDVKEVFKDIRVKGKREQNQHDSCKYTQKI